MCSETDQVFIDGAQGGGLVDRGCGRLMPWEFILEYFDMGGVDLSTTEVRERHDRAMQPAKPNKGRSFKYAVPNTKRYLKLHNGDIYDVDSNTVLNRLELLTMLT